jgi:alpha-L-rhamnosidase
MQIKNSLLLCCVILSLLLVSCEREEFVIRVVDPLCENRIDPLGIDALSPRFSWKLISTQRGKIQSAYQIIVADSKEKLSDNIGNMWDSGRVSSNQSIQVEYAGKKLSSSYQYFWKVRAWDEDGNVSNWCKPAIFEMGILNVKDWHAEWINDGKPDPKTTEDFYKDDPAPLFRYDFNIDKKIDRARLYISGLGYYEAYMNGERIGDQVLDPGWTNYHKRVLYSTYDVTNLILNGENCIGIMLGNGWYNPLPMTMWGYLNLREHLPIGRPRFIAQLKMDFEDGSTEIIKSNEQWKTIEGPVLRNNIYLGEIYDARKEMPGWNNPGFDDSQWKAVKKSKEKTGPLQSQSHPPIKITGHLKPIALSEPKPNVYIYDMGQNFAGWVKLKVKAPSGTRITMRFGELLYDDGTLNPMTSVAGQIKGENNKGESKGGPFAPDTAWQSDTYITRGDGFEYYIPRFTFHAFRYVELRDYPGEPDEDTIEGLRLSSSLKKSGSFECSNHLFNDIQNMTEWTFLSNVFGVQSDCPHRERFGYGGDIGATTDAFIYNFDMLNLYSKVVRDFRETARSDGMLTDTAPFVGIQYCGIGWAMAHPLLLLELYQYYGNRFLVAEQYKTAQKWFDLVVAQNDLIIQDGLSDHESLTPKPAPEMVTPLFYLSATYMAKLANIIGRQDDAQRYILLSEQIKKAYLDTFYEKGSGKFAPNTQASQAFALYTGLAPKEEIEIAVNELVRDIEIEHKNHLSTGIYGTKFMLDMLSKYGRAETAYKIVSQTTFPGWGYMLANGATTLWEHWDFSDNTYSHNHPMFGSVSEWFYKWLAGIQADPNAVGFDKIVIHPQIVDGLDWVKASHESIHGQIVSEWQQNDNDFNLNISIPVNCTATVYLPAINQESITANGEDVRKTEDVKFLKMENNHAILSVGSGNYSFESEIIFTSDKEN